MKSGMSARRFLCVLLSALLIVSGLGFPAASVARAERRTVTYISASGASATQENVTVLTDADVEWSGWVVVTNQITFASRIAVKGVAHLILADGAKLTASEGISVPLGNTLCIYGQSGQSGELIATSKKSAAIGGSFIKTGVFDPAGTIVINGGIVNASDSGFGCAGIGGARKVSGGEIIINGGTVSAASKTPGAGIGAGSDGTGCKITISGGNITAQGGSSGAGIGGGYNSSNNEITISGGTIIAQGGDNSAGIGGGHKASSNNKIIISGGTIIAQGGDNSAGIGGGRSNKDISVTITGGSVNASGGEDAAAIGGGKDNENLAVVISGGDLEATGGAKAAGIGNGRKNKNTSLTVTGGTVAACGGEESQGAVHADAVLLSGMKAVEREPGIPAEIPASDQMTACAGTYVKLVPCESHRFDDFECRFCGAAGQGLTYTDLSGNLCAPENAVKVVSGSFAWTEGWRTLTEDVTITDRVNVSGTVNLLLCDGKTLTAEQGIHVPPGSALIIWGQEAGTGLLQTGELRHNPDSAGIGGNKAESCGVVVVNGGRVKATGGPYAAGIGGGKGGTGGSITLNKGFVNAAGGAQAAGIGGGLSGAGGNIVINQGYIEAVGGNEGAGIGGGKSSSGGTITICGAKMINAAGGAYGAGIGGGSSGSAGTVTICGAEMVYAFGGTNAAGIGGGANGVSGSVIISGGKVSAVGGESAPGIGINKGSLVLQISILGGEVNAVGGRGGAGISVGKGLVSISGGEVTAVAGESAQNEAQAIGHGDSGKVTGTLNLPRMKVTAGPEEASASDIPGSKRVEACRNNRYVHLLPCDPHHYVNGVCESCGDGETQQQTDPVAYCAPDGSLRSCDSWEQVTASTAALDSECCAWYVVTEDVSIPKTRINVSGSVNLILCDGASLTVDEGLHVPSGASLTVWAQSAGSGQLSVPDPRDGYAGIGSNYRESCGSVVINGGNVSALCRNASGAGIGGGKLGAGGKITINAGNVSAESHSGAGIGGGNGGDGGVITINGGEVQATSDYGAGIGGGEAGDGGVITISGGKVIASGTEGSGIGGGNKSGGGIITISGGEVIASSKARNAAIGGLKKGSGGTITITGGTVNAVGADGPGIGGAAYEISICGPAVQSSGESSVYGVTVTASCRGGAAIGAGKEKTSGGSVRIENAAVRATGGGSSAGIGGTGNAAYGSVEIIRSDILAVGGKNGAGIGSGSKGSCDSVVIRNATVEAIGGENGAGIGSGSMGSCDSVVIRDATVEAVGGIYGAGIGGGKESAGGNITLENAVVRATGGNDAAGIGGGKESAGGNITLENAVVRATGGNDAAGIGGGMNGYTGSVQLLGCEVTALGKGKASGIGGGYKGSGGEIVLRGGKITASSQGDYSIGPGNKGAKGTVVLSWDDPDDVITAKTIAAEKYILEKPFSYQTPEGEISGRVTPENLETKSNDNDLIPDNLADAGISFEDSEIYLAFGETRTLHPVVSNPGANPGNYVWRSDNPAVAQIDETTGAVTAMAFGTARISVIYQSETSLGEASILLSVVSSYPVTVSVPEGHGTMISDRSEAVPGATVTLTIQPEEHYDLSELIITCGDELLGYTEVNETTVTFTMPNGPVAVTATFCQGYLIEFLADNGESIQTLKRQDLPLGVLPTYDPETDGVPERAPDDQYTYTFSGWEPEITEVTGDAVYMAVFTETLQSYEIVFQNHDGTVLQSGRLNYGETPEYAGNDPVKANEQGKTWSFSGWTPEIESVRGDAVYTATFEEALALSMGANALSLTNARTVTLFFVPEETGCYQFSSSPCSALPALRIYDGKGMEASSTFSGQGDGMCTLDCAAELTAGTVYFVEVTVFGRDADLTLNVQPTEIYQITVDNTSEHGRIDQCVSSAHVGQMVEPYPYPDEGYAFTGYIITDAAGNTMYAESAFEMPASDITVKATFEKLYRILFKKDSLVGEPVINADGRLWSWDNAWSFSETVVEMLLYCNSEEVEIDSVSITTESGDIIPCYLSRESESLILDPEDENGWVYWFIMPDEPVWIRVTQTRDPEEPEPDPEPLFNGAEFVLPAGLQAIEESAFEGNRSIFTVDIPETCRSIGSYAFRGCTSLMKIRIPNNCQIGEGAFDACGTVYVFAPYESPAYDYCETHENCVFVEEQ